MTPRHMAPSTSSWGRSVGGCGKTVAAIVTVVVLFVALMFAMACQPVDDGVEPADCRELSAPCEGH